MTHNERFAAAVEEVLARSEGETVAVVSHGAVISLFVARANGMDPYAFWLDLGYATLVVLSRADLSLVSVLAGASQAC